MKMKTFNRTKMCHARSMILSNMIKMMASNIKNINPKKGIKRYHPAAKTQIK